MVKKKRKPAGKVIGGRLSRKIARVVQRLIDGAHIRLRLTNAMNILADILLTDADKYFSKNANIHKVFYGVSLKDPMNPVQVVIPAAKHITRVAVEKLNPGVALIWVTRSRVKGHSTEASDRRAVHTPRGQASKRGKKLGDDITGALVL